VAIDRLVASLWPDAAGDTARNSFDNTLHCLRKLLGDDGHVLLRGGALSLNPATCRVDVLALEAALGSADDKRSDIDAMALAALADDALALYRGPFLAGEDEHAAVLSARSRIQSRFVRRMALLGDRLEAAGEFEAAVSVYRRAVEQEPLAEELFFYVSDPDTPFLDPAH
jgi:DNA-binding SARP family transcriptional activator